MSYSADLAELLFQFGNQSVYALRGHNAWRFAGQVPAPGN